MKKFLKYLISSIVQNPNNVSIEEEKEEDGLLNLIVSVHPDDVKIVIGKNGQTIKALRELIRIIAIKERKKFNIKIKE